MTDEDRTHRLLGVLESSFVELALLALVGCVLMAVAFVTRLVLGVDIA